MASLIITSCIAPGKNVPFLTVSNLNERRGEYENTIKWAIESSPFTNIVYVDNSGCNLEMFYEYIPAAQKANKKLEFLSFYEMDDAVSCGKGYGEGRIIEHALLNSKLILEDKEQYFFKITGRLKISNITEIMKNIHLGKIYIMNNYPLYDMLDTRFYGMPVSIYKKFFLSGYKEVNDNQLRYLERIFYDICQENELKYECFRRYPEYLGRSGSTGKAYKENPNQKFFDFLCKTKLFNNRLIYKRLLNLKSWGWIKF